MASAFHDGRGWIAQCRGFLAQGRQKRRVRVPPERLRIGFEAIDAAAYATEVDQACRLLEAARTPANISRARMLKAITDEQADALIRLQPVSAATPGALRIPTVLEAARMHPSSARELVNDVTAAVRHERELGRFCAWAKVDLVTEVRLGLVTDYVDHLTVAGTSWDGRRHALLWLRRATRMGASYGVPDVLGELKLDTRPPPTRGLALSFWSLPELARAAVRATDLRLRVAIGLGGFVGLRPSEIYRVQIPDMAGDLLNTGQKNKQSERLLPLPSILAEWIAELIGQRHLGLLISTHGRYGHGAADAEKRGSFNEASFSNWFDPLMKTASGKRLSPKYLRKSFSTWAFRTTNLPTQHVEAYMGHKTALASIVTGRHYLADLAARELRPSAERIDVIVRAALAEARADLARERRGLPDGATSSEVAS